MAKLRKNPSRRDDLQPALQKGIDYARKRPPEYEIPNDPTHQGTVDENEKSLPSNK